MIDSDFNETLIITMYGHKTGPPMLYGFIFKFCGTCCAQFEVITSRSEDQSETIIILHITYLIPHCTYWMAIGNPGSVNLYIASFLYFRYPC